MAPTPQELSLLLYPIVPESLQHNTRVSPCLVPLSSQPSYLSLLQVLSNIRSLTSFLLGISAAILNLESISGFLFYLLGSSVVAILIQTVLTGGRPERYFVGSGTRDLVLGKAGKSSSAAGEVQGRGAWRDVWLGGGVLTEGLSAFVLGWAGVGGVIR